MACDKFLDVLDLDALGFVGADEVADGDLRRPDRQRRPGQREMREKAVDSPFEIAPVGVDRTRDEGEYGRRQVEIRLQRVRRRHPRLQYLQAQRLVERADFNAEASAKARAHALVKRFEIVGWAVGSHDDVPSGVEQRVQRVTELSLDCLALKKLGIVEDQEIDRAQAGRLPRGFCVKRLTDLPMLWSEQWRAIGLQEPVQAQLEPS